MPVFQVLDVFPFTTNKLNYIAYRAGVSVETRPHPVTCHAIQCVEFSPPFFTLEVHCGGGFDVRSLVHDLGNGKYSNCIWSQGWIDINKRVLKLEYFSFL